MPINNYKCVVRSVVRFDYLRDDSGAMVLNELELVEPSLFFRHSKKAAIQFADAILKRV